MNIENNFSKIANDTTINNEIKTIERPFLDGVGKTLRTAIDSHPDLAFVDHYKSPRVCGLRILSEVTLSATVDGLSKIFNIYEQLRQNSDHVKLTFERKNTTEHLSSIPIDACIFSLETELTADNDLAAAILNIVENLNN